jgi:ATP-dependent Zn protease
MDGNRAISKTDIEQEIFNIPPDAERQPMTTAALQNTAWHEAGHALVGLLLDSLKDQIRMASILANNDMLGFVAMIQSEQNATRTSLLDRLCMTLAGRASEEVVFGTDNVTTGAGGMSNGSDLSVARRIALVFVSSYGFSTVHPNWQTSNGLDDEAAKLVEGQYQRAKKLLNDNRARLDGIAKALLERQVLSREELLAQMR